MPRQAHKALSHGQPLFQLLDGSTNRIQICQASCTPITKTNCQRSSCGIVESLALHPRRAKRTSDALRV